MHRVDIYAFVEKPSNRFDVTLLGSPSYSPFRIGHVFDHGALQLRAGQARWRWLKYQGLIAFACTHEGPLAYLSDSLLISMFRVRAAVG